MAVLSPKFSYSYLVSLADVKMLCLYASPRCLSHPLILILAINPLYKAISCTPLTGVRCDIHAVMQGFSFTASLHMAGCVRHFRGCRLSVR